MRNDYPLLACLELGARHLRVPLTDFANPTQRELLQLLRDEGVLLTTTVLWSGRHDLAGLVAPRVDLVDTIEVQVAGSTLPLEDCLRQLRHVAELGRPVSLATILARETVAGKQHPRTRVGYRAAELSDLDRHLGRAGVTIDRVLCRADSSVPPWESMRHLNDLSALENIRAIDWVVDLPGLDDRTGSNRAAEAVFASALLPHTRVFLDPFLDLDRTMDVAHGLLDRQCNPRPAFHAARCLNSILFARPETRTPIQAPDMPGARVIAARRANAVSWLLLPERFHGLVTVDVRRLANFPSDVHAISRFDLAIGLSRGIETDGIAASGPFLQISDVTLLEIRHED
jgi:hypothetical protein